MAGKVGYFYLPHFTCGKTHSHYELSPTKNFQGNISMPAVRSKSEQQLVRTVACWISGGLIILVGFVLAASPDSWPNERFTGIMMALLGAILLPPILCRVRMRIPMLRSIWAPILLGVLAFPFSVLVGYPFVPVGEERSRLRSAAVSEARAAIAKKDFGKAKIRLSRFSQDGDPKVEKLLSELALAQSEATEKDISQRPARAGSITPPSPPIMQDPASIYAERITTYWLPEAQNLPDLPPEDDAEIGRLLTKIDGLAINIADGSALRLSPPQSSLRAELIAVLAKKQLTLLPAMRNQYAGLLRERLFRRDVDVTRFGATSSTLRFTGRIFSFNANIEDMQRANRDVFSRLRFRRVEYRWSEHFDDGYHYDLNVPSDGTVGTWQSGEFEPVSSS